MKEMKNTFLRFLMTNDFDFIIKNDLDKNKPSFTEAAEDVGYLSLEERIGRLKSNFNVVTISSTNNYYFSPTRWHIDGYKELVDEMRKAFNRKSFKQWSNATFKAPVVFSNSIRKDIDFNLTIGLIDGDSTKGVWRDFEFTFIEHKGRFTKRDIECLNDTINILERDLDNFLDNEILNYSYYARKFRLIIYQRELINKICSQGRKQSLYV